MRYLRGWLFAITIFCFAGASNAQAQQSVEASAFDAIRPSLVQIRIDTEGVSPQVCSAFAVDLAPNVVVSANCVAEASSRSIALLASGRTVEATYLGLDEQTGLVAFRIAENIAPVRWANADPQVAEHIVVAGYAYELGPLVSNGIVAGQNLRINRYPVGVMFLDVPIFSGTAGAPVASTAGEVIGIICGVYGTRTETNRGYGVAIHAADARRIVQSILERGGGR